MEGKKEPDGLYHCKVYEVDKTIFLSRSGFDLVQIGTATVRPRQLRNEMVVNYELDPVRGSKTSGRLILERFF